MRMKCPKCGAVLVKALPNNKIIALDDNVAYTKPVLMWDYNAQGKGVLKVAFVCPVCGHVLVEKDFEDKKEEGDKRC